MAQNEQFDPKKVRPVEHAEPKAAAVPASPAPKFHEELQQENRFQPGQTGANRPVVDRPVVDRPVVEHPVGEHPIETGKPPVITKPPYSPPETPVINGGKPNPTHGPEGELPTGTNPPGHVFNPGQPFRPPQGNGWGWQDHDRYRHGWDRWFFTQDPNYQAWRPTINQESQFVADRLNNGDTPGAAAELNANLWSMRGDIYAQNELLSEVNNEQTGQGSTLYLGNWDPIRGSWDNIEVVSPQYAPSTNFMLRTFE